MTSLRTSCATDIRTSFTKVDLKLVTETFVFSRPIDRQSVSLSTKSPIMSRKTLSATTASGSETIARNGPMSELMTPRNSFMKVK